MSDSTVDSSPTRPEPRRADQFVHGLMWILGLIILCAALLKAETDHHRGQLLRAYRRRRHWRKSDIKNLKCLGVNKTALRRMDSLVGTGRPVVPSYRPFADVAAAFITLFDEGSSPQLRRRAFKDGPWWEHFVEALYRGEHVLAKAQRIAGPSEHAERVVGTELGISASTVHQISGEIRRKRNESNLPFDFPAMTLDQYRGCIEEGNQSEKSSLPA